MFRVHHRRGFLLHECNVQSSYNPLELQRNVWGREGGGVGGRAVIGVDRSTLTGLNHQSELQKGSEGSL